MKFFFISKKFIDYLKILSIFGFIKKKILNFCQYLDFIKNNNLLNFFK